MEKFEYKTVVTKISRQRDDIEDSAGNLLENDLNGLGMQGWELVSVIPVATYIQGMTGRYISIFKRKIQ